MTRFRCSCAGSSPAVSSARNFFVFAFGFGGRFISTMFPLDDADADAEDDTMPVLDARRPLVTGERCGLAPPLLLGPACCWLGSFAAFAPSDRAESDSDSC